MIDEPFQLSSHTVKQSNKAFNVKGKASSTPTNDLATVTVQGDGIHLIDVSWEIRKYYIHSHIQNYTQIASQNTLQSFSTGPSTTFAAAATTLVEGHSDDAITRRTFALSGAATKKQKVLSWTESLTVSQSAHLGGQSEHQEFEIDGPATSLHPIPVTPPTMLIGDSDGSCTYAQSDLSRREHIKGGEKYRQLGEAVYAADGASFIGTKADVQRYVVLTVSQSTKDKSIRVVAYQVLNNASRALERLGQASVPCQETAVSVSASSTGELHILDKANVIHSIRIEAVNDDSLSYKHLSTICINDTYKDLTMLALKGSLLLVAAKKDDGVVLTVWDTTLKVMLSEQEAEIPSSFGSASGDINLELSTVSNSSAILTLSSNANANAKSSKRSQAVVMIVPYTVPEQSTILAALGRDAATHKYLKSTAKQTHQKSASPLDPDQAKLEETLSSIDGILKNSETSSDNATNVLNEYFKAENMRLRNIANELFRADLADAALESFSKDAENRITKEGSIKNISTEPVLPRWFVQALVEIIFRNALKEKKIGEKKTYEFQSSHYSRSLVSKLLYMHVVSNDYATQWGGILDALWSCKDTKNLIPAITQVGDIPETALVRTLKAEMEVNAKQREEQRKSKEEGGDEEKMELDGDKQTQQKGSEGFAQVDGVLKAIVISDYTPGLLRRSLYEQFSDGEDVVSLFNKIEEWLQKEFMDPQVDVSKISLKAQRAAIREQVKGIRAPKKNQLSLENLTKFTQILLDAFFPIILHYEKSHHQVDKISRTLKELNEREQAQADLRRLLETFAAKATATKDNSAPAMSVKASKDEKRSIGVGKYAIEQFDLE
ncbi:hypothetical protein E3P99_02968 [Wallemia hederae]|uniref:Uncharacterized protein n=1 Tax=Wallemia hederae TaxID=1540922 RepID=A0A4T0FLY8_9BASI|nr:hypothetical protein E3P99_02968 [Wallemia hederae]